MYQNEFVQSALFDSHVLSIKRLDFFFRLPCGLRRAFRRLDMELAVVYDSFEDAPYTHMTIKGIRMSVLPLTLSNRTLRDSDSLRSVETGIQQEDETKTNRPSASRWFRSTEQHL